MRKTVARVNQPLPLMPRLLLAVLLALLAPAALAQTCTTSWTNPAGGAWETGTNWSAGVPTNASTACITLAGTYTVSQSSADRAIAGLVVGGAGGTQTLTTFNVFSITGDAIVRPGGRWEVLNRTPGGGDGVYTSGTITVEGVLVHNSGTTLLGTAGILDVAPGGTLRVVGNGVGAGGAGSRIRVRGTLEATDCPTTTSGGNCGVNAPIEVIGGTVRAAQGVFFVNAGGTFTGGSVDALAGASLYLRGATGAGYTVSGTLSGAPVGEVFASGGAFAAAPGETTLAVSGTGLQLAGSVILTSAGGTFRNTGRLTHAPTGSNFASINGTTLRNEGQFVMPGTGFGFQNGGLVRNEASGTIAISNQGGLGGVGGSAGRVQNAGLILANGSPAGPGSGATAGTVGVPYDGLAGSTIRVQTGRLDVQAGGSFRDATFDVPAASVLFIAGSASARYAVSGTLSGTPAGEVYVSGGGFEAGTGGATLNIGGTGLQLTGSAFLTSGGGAFLNLGLLRKADTGSNFAGFSGVVVTNRATVDISSFQLLDGAVLRNEAGATLLLPAGGSLNGSGRIDNAGLILRQGNRPGVGGTYSFNGQLRSLPGSELRSNEDRVDLQAPASRSIPDGATLTGTGKFLLPLEIEGIVSPGTAEQPLAGLDFFSAFRLSLVAGSPRVVVDVAAGGASDTLTVGFGSGSGNTRLGGALVVRVRPGFTPAAGDQWTILRTESPDGITGQFGQVVAEGAPADIAFVAERAVNGASLVLRAVAVAPGGAVTVSTTRPVGGGVRPIFLSGPGAAGIAAARLECAGCFDPAGFGTIPATLVGSGTLREARFDLTSPRAFGPYTLVVQRPGQPDVSAAVTVRPYLAFALTTGGVARGARVRPPGGGYNYTQLQMDVRSNADQPAFHLPRLTRTQPDLFAVALATGNPFSSGVVFYESDTASDPLRAPLVVGRLFGDAATAFTFGLRIAPEDVRFPEQPPSGPDDSRVPFGQPRLFTAVGAQHVSTDRLVAVLLAALRGSGSAALTDYLAQVDAADPAAAASAARTTVEFEARGYYTLPSDVLRRTVAALDATAPAPAGLAAAAAGAFTDAFEAVSDAAAADGEAALNEAVSGGGPVADLVNAEIAALFPEGTGADVAAARTDYTALEELLCNVGFGDSIRSIKGIPGAKPGGGGGSACDPPAAPADPNDKTTRIDGFCEMGTVVVDGQEQTRCVRNFVPLAEATQPLFYSVSFENLPQATANAEFVTITDELDPNLDPATLAVTASSSDSTLTVERSGQTVTFRFTGIDLPPNITAPEGQGFVSFAVRPRPGLAEGTEIRNTASIVFDFNPPILTPTVLHEVRRALDLGVVVEAPTAAEAGQAVPVRLLAVNLRGDDAAEATFTLAAPGATLSEATPSRGTCTGSNPVVCTVPDLAAEATFTLDAFVTAAGPGEVVVSASAATPAFDAFAPNDADAATVTVTAVGTEADPDVPRELTLSSPRPNPVRGATTLRWGLPQAASVDVRVYDLLGREVAHLADGEAQEAGWHEARWEASVASGVYVVRVRVGDEVRMRRLTVIR